MFRNFKTTGALFSDGIVVLLFAPSSWMETSHTAYLGFSSRTSELLLIIVAIVQKSCMTPEWFMYY